MAQDQDPVARILRMTPANDAVRADVWDAFQQSRNADELASRLQTIKIPDSIKADLWDLKASQAAAPRTHRTEDYMPKAPEGSAASRFLSNAGEILNPVAMVKGVVDAVSHPVRTAENIYAASADQGSKALTAAREGRYVEAAGHTAGMVPIIGPAAAEAGEQIASGDVAGGLGKGAAMLALPLAPRGVQAVRKAAAKLPESVPAALESGAQARVADVMSPKVGANKTRFANKADDVAPELVKELAEEGAPLTRQGFHGDIKTKLSSAEEALDAAADTRLNARTFETKPILDALKEKRRALTAEAVEGEGVSYQKILVDGKHVTTWIKKHGDLGEDVVPAPNSARVAQIDQAIKEIEALGPVARYEPIRRIRQAYDGPAKAVYSPSLTQDFLKQKGGALGAADVTGVLRDTLAKWDPQTAKANAQYSLYRAADDVLSAAAEVERARPKVGRQIIARLTGGVIGGQQAGAAGAAAGYVAGPIIDSVLASGATTQLKSAALMQRLANAIRKGDVGFVNSLTSQLKRLGATSSAIVGGSTTPSESRTGTAPVPIRP
jgi:hypothetical protein